MAGASNATAPRELSEEQLDDIVSVLVAEAERPEIREALTQPQAVAS